MDVEYRKRRREDVPLSTGELTVETPWSLYLVSVRSFAGKAKPHFCCLKIIYNKRAEESQRKDPRSTEGSDNIMSITSAQLAKITGYTGYISLRSYTGS